MLGTSSPISQESSRYDGDAGVALPPEFGHRGLDRPRAALQLQWTVLVALPSLEDGAMGCSAALDAAKGVPCSADVPQGGDTVEEHPKQPSLLTIISKETEPQGMDRWVSLEQ